MSCLRNANGQAICQIIDHPDRPSESFCVTCQQRFAKVAQGRGAQSLEITQPGGNDVGFLPILGSVFMAMLVVMLVSEQPEPQPAETMVPVNAAPVNMAPVNAAPTSEFSMGQG